MSDMPDYAAKIIRDLPDWRAVLAQDLDLDGAAICPPAVGVTLIDYTVPANKYLLIYDWAVAMIDGKGNVYGDIYNVTAGVIVAIGGGVQGFQSILTKPKVARELQNIHVIAAHWEAVDRWLEAYLGGILL